MDENEWDLLDCQAFVSIRLTLSKLVAFKIKKTKNGAPRT